MVLELGKDMDMFLTPGEVCSHSDRRNKSASGSSSQVKSRKQLERIPHGMHCLGCAQAWEGGGF